jgi:hypothetical protein
MRNFIKNAVIPPGPVLVLTLVGLMILSGLLYYRAVRIQRFLEPTLAVSQPRVLFYNDVLKLLVEEFGGGEIQGVRFVGSSIIVHKSLLAPDPHHGDRSFFLMRMGNVFLKVLKAPELRAYLDFISISPRAALGSGPVENKARRLKAQAYAEDLLDGLFASVPELQRDYAIYFEASAVSVYSAGDDEDWVEFRLAPSDRLHIDVLERVRKYVE